MSDDFRIGNETFDIESVSTDLSKNDGVSSDDVHEDREFKFLKETGETIEKDPNVDARFVMEGRAVLPIVGRNGGWKEKEFEMRRITEDEVRLIDAVLDAYGDSPFLQEVVERGDVQEAEKEWNKRMTVETDIPIPKEGKGENDE